MTFGDLGALSVRKCIPSKPIGVNNYGPWGRNSYGSLNTVVIRGVDVDFRYVLTAIDFTFSKLHEPPSRNLRGKQFG